MNIGILICSERKKGNSETLANYIKKKFSDLSFELIFLRDFEIKECDGCMRCVFKKEKCKIEDDLYKLIDNITKNDALILIAPTYVLTIPGKLKMVIDRFLCIYEIIKDLEIKPAMSIGVASPIDWDQFELPFMNIFLLSLGYKVTDSFLLYGAGPGEVLLDENLYKIDEGINKILNFQEKPYESTISDRCPVDYNKNFEHIEGEKFRCPFCLTPCYLRNNSFYFYEKDLNKNRWTKEKMKEHFEEWILKTKERFKELLPKIIESKNKIGL
ncbi:MAG: flavodoxin family protein [candidate division WOR-3 bacterium]